MKLKDILDSGTSSFNQECKIVIFNKDIFEERLENGGFNEILIPEKEDVQIYPDDSLVEDSILITMMDESE